MIDPCPAERTKRSRSGQRGFDGECFRYLVHSTYAIGAAPIGNPGCPEFACCTASAARNRIVLTASCSSWGCPILLPLTARLARTAAAPPRSVLRCGSTLRQGCACRGLPFRGFAHTGTGLHGVRRVAA